MVVNAVAIGSADAVRLASSVCVFVGVVAVKFMATSVFEVYLMANIIL